MILFGRRGQNSFRYIRVKLACMKYSFAIIGLLSSLLIACRPVTLTPQITSSSENKFSDAIIRRIYTLQDERKADSLLPYLTHAQTVYRLEAARALASVQDKRALPGLIKLLTDPDAPVRRAAAYALGQLGENTAEGDLLKSAATEKEPVVRAEILEALGKCASQTGLDYLSNYKGLNDTENAGLAWGLYRTNNKNLNYTAAITKAINLLAPTHAAPVRLGATHFLARTPKLDFTLHQAKILTTAQTDSSPEVRMAATLALGKIKTATSTAGLLTIIRQDPDYRVRINAIRGLTNADDATVKGVIYKALEDKNINTALAASDFVLAKASPADAPHLLPLAAKTNNWRVRATLLAAALKIMDDKAAVSEKIKSQYTGTTNIYEKGALLAALGHDLNNYKFIQQVTFSTVSPVLATYGLEALSNMRQQLNFPENLKMPFAAIFRKALESGDGALVGIAASLLAIPALEFNKAYPDPGFLKNILATLQLPRDMETYQELDKAIRSFAGLPPGTAPANPFTHPINWTLVKSIKPRQKVLIKTGKGPITLTLFTEEAPATVANFVQLARAGFYNQKNFHRVAPNFVVQGGDPRGDGWGGTDYAIRSEFANLRYGEGFVGMASAGKDTESCQWFITHSPTPHLDGRYTIFGRVTLGMAVVHQLEIGDKIESVTLID
jgi:cyclophilin family peptidyl-prolyl cis-trans isomerase/HEAT repeat protein